MSKTSLLTVSLLASLALGSATPAFAGDLNALSVERLRQAPGNEGVGFGALVLPSYVQQGQFTATLYNASDRPVYEMAGHLSLYLASQSLIAGRLQFGGLGGSLRSVTATGDPHPSFVGFVDGTWTMDGQGRGDMNAMVYSINSDGIWIPLGLVNGEFDAVSISSSNIGAGQVGDDSSGSTQSSCCAGWNGMPAMRTGPGLTGGQHYGYIEALKQALAQYELTSEFRDQIRIARAVTALDSLGERTSDVADRIAAARKQAAQAGDSGFPGGIADSADRHLEAHLLVRYKIVD